LIYLFGFWNYANGFSVTFLPLMLWLSDEAERPVRRQWVLIVSSALLPAFLFYNANAQAAVLVSGLHFAYALVVSESRRERLARLRLWAFAWIVGLALYGPVFVTQLRLIPESVRSIRGDLAALPGLTAAVRDWLTLYAVVPLGAPALAALGVPPKAPPYGTWYVGPLGLAILALSWGMKRRTRRERLIASLLLAIPLFDLLATTALPRLQEHFGFLRSFQFVRLRLFLPFALSAGVAVGLERLGPKVWSLRGHRKWWIAAVAAFLLLPGVLCARMLFYVTRRYSLPGYGAFEWGRLAGYAGAVLYFGLWAVLCIVFASRVRSPSSRGLVGRLNWGAGLGVRPGMALVLSLLLLDRVIYQRIERYVESSRLASFEQALHETPAIRFLRMQPNPHAHRILMFADRSRWNSADHPNKLMYWGLYAADGYQNVYPLRYHEVFGLLTKPHLERDPARFRYYHGWGQRAYAFGPEINSSIASLMGIRWFYARGVSVPEGAWREVFRQEGEAVYENLSVLPRAFVAPRTRSFPNRASLLSALEHAPLQELRTTAFVEETGSQTAGAGVAGNASAGSVIWKRYSPDHVAFEVRSETRGILVLTDTFVPGWRALVNGRERRVFPVDGCFRGVSVPAGSSEVALDYSPAYTRLGVWIAMAGLATLGAVAVLGEKRGSVTVGRIRPATGDHRAPNTASKVRA
jgi:hypothetical protein